MKPTFLTSSSPFSVNSRGEIKVGQDKGMLPALGDFVSRSLQLNCRIVSPFPIPRKRKNSYIHRENKILSHGLYNWAYTLFTVQSLIQIKKEKNKFTPLAKLIAITRLPISADKPLQKQ